MDAAKDGHGNHCLKEFGPLTKRQENMNAEMAVLLKDALLTMMLILTEEASKLISNANTLRM